MLRQIIDVGGISPKKEKKAAKLPFFLSHEERMDFQYSHSPIPISEIANRINALRNADEMKKLFYGAITSWLVEIGALKKVTEPNGKTPKRPTAMGNDLGITTELRQGSNGEYTIVLYDMAAQRFIIDNLDAPMEREKTATENQGLLWDADHEKILLELFHNGTPVSEIAAALKRTPTSVRARLKKLGLI